MLFVLLIKLLFLSSFCRIGLHLIKDIIHIVNTDTISIWNTIYVTLWLFVMIFIYKTFNSIDRFAKESIDEIKE